MSIEGLLKWFRQRIVKLLGQKTVSVPLCSPGITHGLNLGHCGKKRATDPLSHGTAFDCTAAPHVSLLFGYENNFCPQFAFYTHFHNSL